MLGGATPTLARNASSPADDDRDTRYVWGGTVSVQGVSEAEVCVLVEGGPEVARATCRVSIAGREVTARQVGSAGQFGAATDASPDNWTWFIVPVPMGDTTAQIELTAPAEEMSVGIYLRGFVPADNDPAPAGDDPVFPVLNPERRAWSQTLLPLTPYPTDS